MEDEKTRLTQAALETMTPSVTVDNLSSVKYETEDNLLYLRGEINLPSSSAPRMFSLNQIRELFYLHLHRSDLKYKVEITHEDIMEDHMSYMKRIEKITEDLRVLIAQEKRSVIDMIEIDRQDEVKFRHF